MKGYEMRYRLKTDSKGFTLLEVMVSMIILGIGILGFAPMVVLSIDSNNISKDISVASNLAKETMEYYEGLNSIPAVPFTNSETGLNGGYTRIVNMRDNVSDSLIADGLYQLDVTISWIDKLNIARSLNYSTFIIK